MPRSRARARTATTIAATVLHPLPARRLVVAEGVDQLGLGHGGAALDAELAGALDQVLLGPVGVGRALSALPAYLLARAPRGRVGDPGRLLLAVPLAAQRLVGVLVFDLCSRHG